MDCDNGEKTRSEQIRPDDEKPGQHMSGNDFTFANISDLYKVMLDATPDCIKLIGADGTLFMMNRAGCLALGVSEEEGFGMPWLPLLPGDVHASGQAALAMATAGSSARFAGRSECANIVMHWDNLLTPLVEDDGQVNYILCVSRDITAQIRMERELAAAAEREQLLAREMHHRVKNLFALVSGLVFIAERETGGNGSSALALNLHDKLQALSRASDAAFPPGGHGDKTRPIDLADLIRALLAPYGDRCTIIARQVTVPPTVVTTLALAFHEYATNSVKYGALGKATGNVTVRWLEADGMLSLAWIETGANIDLADAERRGFGTDMVERIVRSAGGRVHRTWRPDGLVIDLHLPIKH